jgi:hypothetical protein
MMGLDQGKHLLGRFSFATSSALELPQQDFSQSTPQDGMIVGD